MATLTKAQIVENLFAKNLFSKGESAHVIETLFELVKQSLEGGEDVLISGFGKFCLRQKHQRRGRNPQSGHPIMLPDRKVVTFKCSAILREKMNQKEKTEHAGRTTQPGRPERAVTKNGMRRGPNR